MDKNSLVEDEGVNAGSAEQLEDGRSAGAAKSDARSGGNPADVEPKAPVEDVVPAENGGDSRLLGAPEGDDRYPGQVHGSAGQDAGSIE